jgi:L-ascorbate 6-phosphate lactonase
MNTGRELIHEINSYECRENRFAFWWLGQLGYAIKLNGKIIYIDMYLSGNELRRVSPAFKPEEVDNADYFFGTHDHIDHIDRDVWHQLSISSPKAKFVVSGVLVDQLSLSLGIVADRFIGIKDGETLFDDDLGITGVASAHEFLDRDPVTGLYPHMGFVLSSNGRNIYHSGDCCIYEGLETKLKNCRKFDAMFLPINGRDAIRYKANCIGNMTYQEAVDLAGTLKPGLVIPGHYEMFANNSENPELFRDYLHAKYPHVKYWIGEHCTIVEV